MDTLTKAGDQLDIAQLKPCPFCGGKPEINGGFNETFSIRCKKNQGHALFGTFSMQATIDDWNTRWEPPTAIETLGVVIDAE